MTTTPKYLQEDIDGCITTSTPKYMEMDKFSMILADINKYAEQYYDEGTAFYMDDVLIDTDAWVHESCEDDKYKAILAYHEVTEEELDKWVEENPEVAHWVAHVSHFAKCENDELQEFINNYESEDLY